MLTVGNSVANVQTDPARAAEGLIAFYPFDEGTGKTVTDRSGYDQPMNLTLCLTAADAFLATTAGCSGVIEVTLVHSGGGQSTLNHKRKMATFFTTSPFFLSPSTGGC